MVQAIWLVAATLLTFSIGYLTYSRYLTQFLELDDANETPAHRYEDGQEYIPAKKPVLLGHHYSSIAGGAPIVGPITAGVIWGWVPALLWIAIGNPLMGAVHDFVTLSGSLRHEGKSIGYIIGEYVGERGKNMLLWFSFLTIVLVTAVFALVVAIVFNAYPQSATASLMYIILALVFGVYLYQFDLPFLPGTAVFVLGVFAGVFVGVEFPIALFPAAESGAYPAGTMVLFGSELASMVPAAGSLGANTAGWLPVVFLYAAIASVLPVWMLLQPRDFLSSFLLYAGVGGAVIAIIVGTLLGTSSEPLVIELEPYYGFMGTASLPLFPLLFVTIACGTISGFHALVSSGTTSKQLYKETDARTIGYGGMLGEGVLATVALATVSIAGVTAGGGIGRALPNFADGGSIMLTSFGIPVTFGAPFMALVLVSFLLTSTDTAVRLGRYMAEEIVETRDAITNPGVVRRVKERAAGRNVNAVIQVTIAYVLVASGTWADLWPLFGGANQLLASLALLTATVWLANWDDSKQLFSTGVPMVLMTVITILALLYLALYQNLYEKFILGGFAEGAGIATYVSVAVQIIVALVLVWLAVQLVLIGYKNVKSQPDEPATAVADGGEQQKE